MQVYRKTKWGQAKTMLFFLLFLYVAYFPVSSFLFFLKNDAFNGYFPAKYFISESLSSGHVPYWNPYINFGLPQYGDMNAGYWSPITWIIGYTVGYNPYSFTIEILFYLFVAAAGMYFLCRSYQMSSTVAIIAGISYMSCGYMVGHLQHFNWISGAALLPWCLWGYINMQRKGWLRNVIIAAGLFYFYLSSAHPGLIIGGAYFFIAFMLYRLYSRSTGNEMRKPAPAKSVILSHVLLILFLGLLSAGMIIGYLDVLPHITRGEKVSEVAGMANPFTLQSLLSVVLPMGITQGDTFFNTDVSMRNFYFGLPLFIFFLYGLFHKLNREQRFYLVCGAIFLLLSLGGIFKTITYYIMPGMAYVRMNGEFVIFPLLGFIVVAAFSLDDFIKKNKPFAGSITTICYSLTLIFLVAALTGLVMMFVTGDGFIFHLREIVSQAGISGKLKKLVDSISFYDCLWMQGILQVAVMTGIKYSLHKKKTTAFIWICVTEIALATLLNLPFTGVGKASVDDIDTILNKAPVGIPIPSLRPPSKSVDIGSEESGMVGDWSFYNKQIGTVKKPFYPVELKSTQRIYVNDRSRFADKSFLFLQSGSDAENVTILTFYNDIIELQADSKENDVLVYQQNWYPHWNTTVNSVSGKAKAYDQLFLSAEVQKGRNYIQFEFDPKHVKTGMMISLVGFVVLLIVLLLAFTKRFSPS